MCLFPIGGRARAERPSRSRFVRTVAAAPNDSTSAFAHERNRVESGYVLDFDRLEVALDGRQQVIRALVLEEPSQDCSAHPMMNVVQAALWLGNLGLDDRKLPAIIHAPPD